MTAKVIMLILLKIIVLDLYAINGDNIGWCGSRMVGKCKLGRLANTNMKEYSAICFSVCYIMVWEGLPEEGIA
jgi:hypothetical protein